jgi:hypothetical protein
LKSDGASIRHQHRRRAVWHSPFSYFLRCLLRIMEKYIAAKAASSTPPNIRIKVVIICSPISTSKIKVARVQQPICSPKTRRSRCRLIPLRYRSLLMSRPVRSLPLWLTVLAITDLSFPGATLLTPPPCAPDRQLALEGRYERSSPGRATLRGEKQKRPRICVQSRNSSLRTFLPK